jgi:IclR family transcriptional regulator, acetate operon repressor
MFDGADSDDRLGRVQSLVRAFGILDQLAKPNLGLTLTEIAKAVGLPRSTAHRLLTTMEALHYVEFDNPTQRWSVGIQAFAVGAAFAHTRDLEKLGRPIIRALMQEARDTVSISVPEDHAMAFVGQAEPVGLRSISTRTGARLPMHATACGKALLAARPEVELDSYLATANLVRRTPRSLTDRSALAAELKRVRERGYAVDDEEFTPGIRCVGAVVVDDEGVARAALSLSGPAARLRDDRLESLGSSLGQAASRLAQEIARFRASNYLSGAFAIAG